MITSQFTFQFIKLSIELVKILWVLFAKSTLAICQGSATPTEQDQCWHRESNAARVMSVIFGSAWYSIAEYIPPLFPIIKTKLRSYFA